MLSMEPTVQILLPHLAADIVPPSTHPSLQSIAAMLPPVSRGGFEVRLGTGTPQADLHQCLISKHGDAHALVRHFAEKGSDDIWLRLQSFFHSWIDPNHSVSQHVGELWLEWDNDSPKVTDGIPALFFDLPADLSVDDLQNMIETILVTLRGEQARPIAQHSIKRILTACAKGEAGRGRVSHIGVMLSRPADIVRINVKGLTPGDLLPFLQAIEWSGNRRAACDQMAWASDMVDHITLALDVGATILPRLGLECFLIEQPVFEPRWHRWLDALVDQQLCFPHEKKALLAWPGVSDPAHSPAPWPDHMILASLFRSAHEFSVIERKLNHIKLTLHENRTVSAKGYLWFGESWVKTAPFEPAKSPIRAPDPRSKQTATDEAYLQQVQAYYDFTTKAYVDHVGVTLQADLIGPNVGQDDRASNLFLADRAGITPGQRILDAGCGVCGPAIHIAQAIPDTVIDGISISPVQVEVALKMIAAADLLGRVRPQVGDYHTLPFPDETFDVAYFFESSGYTPHGDGLRF